MTLATDVNVYWQPELAMDGGLPGALKGIYYYLYSHSNLSRAERLVTEVLRLLFCKLFAETNGELASFYVTNDDSAEAVSARVQTLFERVKIAYADVFDSRESLYLDAQSITYVVKHLQGLQLTTSGQDAIGAAFEAFIGPRLRGEKGQFFTPRNVAKMMVEFLDPRPGERIADPACGAGGFLTMAAAHIRHQTGNDANGTALLGIDKEPDLAKVAKAYLAIAYGGREGVYCCDSLDATTWSSACAAALQDGTFDIVLTNPPFGTRISLTNRHLLRAYDLGHRWAQDSADRWAKTTQVADKQDPQILFVERCVRLLKPGGRMGIVLPEGVFGNQQYGYVLAYLRERGDLIGLVDCPRTVFQPSTDTKTNILFFRKHVPSEAPSRQVFLSVVRKCGHDRRGRPLRRPDGSLDDEFALVVPCYQGPSTSETRLGFRRNVDALRPDYLIPRYYDPEIERQLDEYRQSGQYVLRTIQQLTEDRLLTIHKGHEPGAEAYGTGSVPFIRTSDVANWEIAYDPTKSVSEQVYETFHRKQGLRPGDILLVNDGRYRIGNTCILTEHDTHIVVQSHFRILRSTEWERLNPFLVLYLLKTPFVRLQIQSKTVIQSTIATLGSRLREIILPFPQDETTAEQIAETVERIVRERARLLAEARQIDSFLREANEED